MATAPGKGKTLCSSSLSQVWQGPCQTSFFSIPFTSKRAMNVVPRLRVDRNFIQFTARHIFAFSSSTCIFLTITCIIRQARRTFYFVDDRFFYQVKVLYCVFYCKSENIIIRELTRASNRPSMRNKRWIFQLVSTLIQIWTLFSAEV